MKRKKKQRLLPVAVVGTCITAVAAGAFALMRNFLNSPAAPPPPVVEQIHLVRPPPPPPDQPPPPPPPPEEKVDIAQPQKPAPTPSSQPPPGAHLGLDAAGAAGSDAFGLMANQGGRDLLAGGGGSVYQWYAGVLQTDLRNLLQDDAELRKGTYRATFRLWLRHDGSVERVLLADSSGDRASEKDKEVRKRILALTRISEAPPPDIPEPITVVFQTRS
ncbi:MAG TPA: TonB C-terminal domain-containing protein [Steroidobacteraceae bacterium]|nr:TonB C-terminal domain-containing protein [Steroidobacteraceae bacterium]